MLIYVKGKREIRKTKVFKSTKMNLSLLKRGIKLVIFAATSFGA